MANESLVELQRAAKELRDGLKGVDEDIKKLTGRDPSETQRIGANRRIQLKRTPFQRGNRSDEPVNKQRRESDGVGNRRWGRTVQMGTRFSRDEEPKLDSSGEEDESSKPAIQSVVAAESKPVRLQSKSVDEDKQVRSRNKRMFGLLIGTLQKFKDDTEQKSQRERRREEIEKKLEQKEEQEKQELSSQRRELFQTRKQKQQELRNLERKMENAMLKEEVASHNKPLENFIKLKSNPCIFYLPSKHNDATIKLLEESKASVQEIQNAKFRDMDLDAGDYGFGSFNKGTNNGKRFIGRVIDMKDVSHRDLFEEEKQQDENEGEVIEDSERTENQRVERMNESSPRDQEMRGGEFGVEEVTEKGPEDDNVVDEEMRSEDMRIEDMRSEEARGKERRSEAMGAEKARGENTRSEDVRVDDMRGEEMRVEYVKREHVNGQQMNIEGVENEESSQPNSSAIDSFMSNVVENEYVRGENLEEIKDKQLVIDKVHDIDEDKQRNNVVFAGGDLNLRMPKQEDTEYIRDNEMMLANVVGYNMTMENTENFVSDQQETINRNQQTSNQIVDNDHLVNEGNVSVKLDNETEKSDNNVSFMHEFEPDIVIPGLDLIGGYQGQGN